MKLHFARLGLMLGLLVNLGTYSVSAQEGEKVTKELLRLGQGAITAVDWRPDGKALIIATSLGVELYNDALKKINTLEGSVNDFVWSIDGSKIATAGADETVKIWRGDDGKLLSTLKGHTDKVNAVQWSKDDATLASAANDKTVIIWDVASGKSLLALSWTLHISLNKRASR
jgi:WD40 repeat protein